MKQTISNGKILYLSSIYSKYKPKKAIRNTMLQAMKDLRIEYFDDKEQPLKAISKRNIQITRDFLHANLDEFMGYILSVTYSDMLSWQDADERFSKE